MLLVPLAITFLVLRRKKQVQARNIAIPIIASTFILTTTLSVLTFRIEGIQSTINIANNPQPAPWAAAIPDQDTFEVGEWIRNNTPTAAILASNSFCCWNDEAWLSLANQQLNIQGARSTAFGEDGFGGSNFLLASVSSRRFLLAGPRLAIAFGIASSEIQQRLAISVEFGSIQTTELENKLRTFGVDFFVIDKLASSGSNFQVPAIFENERYIVFGL